MKKQKKKLRDMKSRTRTKDVVLRGVVSYARHLAEEWGGWTNPDVRIFYANGKVREFFNQTKKR